jgi:hypothetical protein
MQLVNHESSQRESSCKAIKTKSHAESAHAIRHAQSFGSQAFISNDSQRRISTKPHAIEEE